MASQMVSQIVLIQYTIFAFSPMKIRLSYSEKQQNSQPQHVQETSWVKLRLHANFHLPRLASFHRKNFFRLTGRPAGRPKLMLMLNSAQLGLAGAWAELGKKQYNCREIVIRIIFPDLFCRNPTQPNSKATSVRVRHSSHVFHPTPPHQPTQTFHPLLDQLDI